MVLIMCRVFLYFYLHKKLRNSQYSEALFTVPLHGISGASAALQLSARISSEPGSTLLVSRLGRDDTRVLIKGLFQAS